MLYDILLSILSASTIGIAIALYYAIIVSPHRYSIILEEKRGATFTPIPHKRFIHKTRRVMKAGMNLLFRVWQKWGRVWQKWGQTWGYDKKWRYKGYDKKWRYEKWRYEIEIKNAEQRAERRNEIWTERAGVMPKEELIHLLMHLGANLGSDAIWVFYGECTAPSKIYMDNSYNISLQLSAIKIPSVDSKWMDKISKFLMDYSIDKQDNDNSPKKVAFKTDRKTDDKSEATLEAELQAAAIKIAGDVKQEQSVSSGDLYYNWNCHFPNAGVHQIKIIITLINPPSRQRVGEIELTVKVARIDHMTQNQIQIALCFSAIIGVASAIFTIAKNSKQIGLW